MTCDPKPHLGPSDRYMGITTEVPAVIRHPWFALAVMAIHGRIMTMMERERAEDDLAECWFAKWPTK